MLRPPRDVETPAKITSAPKGAWKFGTHFFSGNDNQTNRRRRTSQPTNQIKNRRTWGFIGKCKLQTAINSSQQVVPESRKSIFFSPATHPSPNHRLKRSAKLPTHCENTLIRQFAVGQWQRGLLAKEGTKLPCQFFPENLFFKCLLTNLRKPRSSSWSGQPWKIIIIIFYTSLRGC